MLLFEAAAAVRSPQGACVLGGFDRSNNRAQSKETGTPNKGRAHGFPFQLTQLQPASGQSEY